MPGNTIARQHLGSEGFSRCSNSDEGVDENKLKSFSQKNDASAGGMMLL